MFTSISDFLQTWEKESAATQRIFDALTDSSLAQKVTDEDRNLGRIAWHLVTAIPEMVSKTGLTFESIKEDAPLPKTAREIAEAYQQASSAMVNAIKNQWKDETLLEERDMFGQLWKIGATLYMLILHEVHHRGQMTILMRQAGLKVPGVYGPSREEWGQFGMEAPVL